MKKQLVIIMALGLFAAMPVMAAEHEGMMKMDSHEGMKMETSEGMRECALQAESIQQKINRIHSDINQGSKKYSTAELKSLNAKLQEANKLLEDMAKGGN